MSISSLISSYTAEDLSLLEDDIEETELSQLAEEVEEASAEAEKAEDEQEDLENTEETLESIAVCLREDRDNGGITPQAARYARVAAKAVLGEAKVVSIMGRELDGMKNPIMTMESYGSTYSQEEATALTMESISDTIKRIWDGIKNAVRRAINAVVEFFARIFRGTKGLQKQAGDLRKELADAKSKTWKKDQELKVGAWATRIHINGSIRPAQVAGGVKTVVDVLDTTYDSLSQASSFYNGLASNLVDAANARRDAKEIVNFCALSLDQMTKIEQKVLNLSKKELPGGKVLIGETEIAVSIDGVSETGDTTKNASSSSVPKSTRMYIKDTNERRNRSLRADSIKDAIAMDVKQCEEVLDNVDRMISIIDGRKRALDEVTKARREAVKAGDTLVKESNAGWFEEKWTQAQLRVVLRLANINITRNINTVTSYSWGVARSALIMVDRSIKASVA